MNICIVFALIIQKDSKVWFRKIALFDLNWNGKKYYIEPLSMKMLRALLLSLHRYRVNRYEDVDRSELESSPKSHGG